MRYYQLEQNFWINETFPIFVRISSTDNKQDMKKRQSITNVYKSEEIYSSELDMLTRDEILGKKWSDGKWPETIILNRVNNKWQGESEPIKIDFVINTLEKLKKDGCNYVEIMFHEDHHGYYFNGLDIHRSTEEELAAEDERVNIIREKNKEKEIKDLEAKLAKLKKS